MMDMSGAFRPAMGAAKPAVTPTNGPNTGSTSSAGTHVASGDSAPNASQKGAATSGQKSAREFLTPTQRDGTARVTTAETDSPKLRGFTGLAGVQSSVAPNPIGPASGEILTDQQNAALGLEGQSPLGANTTPHTLLDSVHVGAETAVGIVPTTGADLAGTGLAGTPLGVAPLPAGYPIGAASDFAAISTVPSGTPSATPASTTAVGNTLTTQPVVQGQSPAPVVRSGDTGPLVAAVPSGATTAATPPQDTLTQTVVHTGQAAQPSPVSPRKTGQSASPEIDGKISTRHLSPALANRLAQTSNLAPLGSEAAMQSALQTAVSAPANTAAAMVSDGNGHSVTGVQIDPGSHVLAAQTDDAQTPSPPKSTKFSDALMTQIKRVHLAEGQTRVALQPRGLGEIDIDIQSDDDGITRVVVRVENPAVLNALHDTKPELARALGLAEGSTLDFQEQFSRNNRQSAQDPARSLASSEDATADLELTDERQVVLGSGALDLVT